MASAPLSPAAGAAAAAAEENRVTRTIHPTSSNAYFSALDSISRVTIAGFGGFLAGLSLARRGGGGAGARQAAAALSTSSRAATKGGANKQANAIVRTSEKAPSGMTGSNNAGTGRLPRQRVIRSTPPSTGPYVDRALPYTWAICVASFAGILEFARVTSPSSTIWRFIRWSSSKYNESSKNDERNFNHTPSSAQKETGGHDSSKNKPLDPSMKTICDFLIGGSMAGALFKGTSIRTRVGARFDASIMGISKPPTASKYVSAVRGKPLSGLLPGAALGLLAGVATVAVDHAQVAVEELFGPAAEGETNARHEERAVIPADINAMSNEELVNSIEKLKRGKSEACEEICDHTQSEGPAKDEIQTSQQSGGGEMRETKNILSALGFRAHPSQ